MKQDSSSSSQLSEEQKQIALKLNPFQSLLAPEASLVGSNQQLERLSSQRNHQLREEITTKAAKKSKRGAQEHKNLNRGHWSTQENKKYHWFLQIHYTHFVNRHMRRTDKIFKTMQLFIGTRQAEQCRSHHQKMQKKYQNFISIISSLREIHYFTQDTNQMQQEIESNGIQITEKLATIEELKAYKNRQDLLELPLMKKAPSVKSPKPDKSVLKVEPIQEQPKLEITELAEEYKQRQNEEIVDPINMFDQSRNLVGDLQMYQDNSCIFQSIFKTQH